MLLFKLLVRSLFGVYLFLLNVAMFVKGQQEIGLYAICNIPEQTELFFDYCKHGDGTTTTANLARMKSKLSTKPK